MAEMTTDPVVTPSAPAPQQQQPVASYVHTAVVLAIMAAVATFSYYGRGGRPASPMGTYLTTIVWQWGLFGLVYVGMRKRIGSLRDFFGPRWKQFDDGVMDFVIAGGFLFVTFAARGLVMLFVIKVLGMGQEMTSLAERMKGLEFIIPRTPLDVGLFVLLSVTAGIVEEFVFRGYLQKQMIALTHSVAGGVVLSGVIFGLGHAYQGAWQVVQIAVTGILFGVLAQWRGSLKPGIIAHAAQNTLAGVLLYLLSRGLLPTTP